MNNFAKNGIQEAILSQKRKILDERSPKKTNKEKTPLFLPSGPPRGGGPSRPAEIGIPNMTRSQVGSVSKIRIFDFWATLLHITKMGSI